MKTLPKDNEALWFGTEASFNELQAIELKAGEMRADIFRSNQTAQVEEEKLPYLLNIENGVGIVTIAGPMTNKTSWYDEYLKVATYSAIREAVVAAAEHPDVSYILLDINSGGGTVNGVSDAGNLISMVNDKVKPVVAFTDGNMCSAAYWLGCSAGNVFATNTATVGSIGVIATHFEYSKQLKEEGVTATVMRAGKFKALINSVEPLTETAKAQMEGQLQAAYKVFVQYVAEARNEPYDHVDEKMAQGREFFGEQALAAGLVDGITSFDSLVSMLQAKIQKAMIDNGNNYSHNSRNPAIGANNMTKKALTEQQIAALAAGGSLAASTETKTPEQIAADEAAAAAAKAAAEAAAGTPEASAQKPEETKAPEAQAGEVVAFLQGQVKEKDAALIEANVKIRELEAKLADQGAAHAELVGIAVKATNNMQIALGGSAIKMDGMTATAVLAEHKRVADQFLSQFKAGGVAAVDAAEASKGKEGVVIDGLFRARLAAAGSTAKAN